MAAWFEWWWRNRESGWTRWATGYGLPVMALVATLTPPYTPVSLAFKAIALIFLVATALWSNLRVRHRYEKEVRRPEFSTYLGVKQYSLTALDVTAADETGQIRTGWAHVRDVAVVSQHIYLVLDTVGFILPRDQLAPEVEEAVLSRGRALGDPTRIPAIEPRDVVATVSFLPEESDERARAAPLFRLSVRQRLQYLVFGGAIGVVGGILSGYPLAKDPLGALCTAGVSGSFTLGVAWLMRWEGKRRYARQSLTGLTEVSLTPAGLLVQTPHATEQLAWSAVGRLRLEGAGLRAETGAVGGVLVP
ncbi:MAG: hypothetical protein ACRDHF_19215, partial [Tepidiformaceae bacterium]